MIVDARDIADRPRLDCDICIIGAGAAGIALALELDHSALRVCMLESGGFSYEPQAQDLLKGEVAGGSYPELHETRLAAFGGSTALWAGWCRPLDPIDFQEREWVRNSGWPFDLTHLVPFYRRAQAICELGPYEYGPDLWETRTGSRRLPMPSSDFATQIVQISRSNFGHRHRSALSRSTNIQIVLHANVLRLHMAASGTLIERTGVAALTGRTFDVTAQIFVLAAGGIENPRLLLLSGDCPERSIGNDRGLVGRYFMEHAFLNAGRFVPRERSQPMAFYGPNAVPGEGSHFLVRAGLMIDPAAARREQLLNGAVFFHPAYESHPVFDSPEVKAMLEMWEKLRGRAVPGGLWSRALRALRAPHKLAIAASRKIFAHPTLQPHWRTRALLECAPDRNNLVSLSSERDAFGRPRARIRWRPGDQDLYSARRIHALLDSALRNAGLGRFEARLQEQHAWLEAIEGGKHHMGTTRMHPDPARGVVDANCKVHGTANLYIAGSSVFPTGGFANPTLTIVALAARLAAHLAKLARA